MNHAYSAADIASIYKVIGERRDIRHFCRMHWRRR